MNTNKKNTIQALRLSVVARLAEVNFDDDFYKVIFKIGFLWETHRPAMQPPYVRCLLSVHTKRPRLQQKTSAQNNRKSAWASQCSRMGWSHKEALNNVS